jgi:plasmid stability protein
MLALLSLLAESCYRCFMATLTIRNLDEKVKRKLQVRAALNGRSMEAEARVLLSETVGEIPATLVPDEDLGTAIHKRFAALGGVDLEIPPRQFSSPVPSSVPKEGLGTAVHKLFAPLGGVELEIPPRRKSHRQIPTFE